MPYNSSTGIISAPDNTDDMVAATGTNSHTIGAQVHSDKLNRDSLIKPIRIATQESSPWVDYFTQGDYNKPTMDANHLYLAGYKIPRINGSATPDTLLNRFNGATWEYLTPDWECFDHFIGYNSKVRFDDAAWPIINHQIKPGEPIRITLYANQSANKWLVSPYNMPFFEKMYWGVAVYRLLANGNWGIVDAKTNTEQISKGEKSIAGESIQFPAREVLSFGNAEPNSRYLILPFISKKAFSGYANMYLGEEIYCAAYRTPGIYEMKASGGIILTGSLANTLTVDVNATLVQPFTTNGIEFKIKFTNSYTSAIAATGKVRITYYGQTGVPEGTAEVQMPISPSVPAKSGNTDGTYETTTLFTVPFSPWYCIQYTFEGNFTVNSQTYNLQSPLKYINDNGTTTPPPVTAVV